MGLFDFFQRRPSVGRTASGARVKELEAAFRADPNNMWILLEYGDALLDAGDPSAAQRMFQALLLHRLGPDAPVERGAVYLRLAEVHRRQGDRAKAISMAERVPDGDPDAARAQAFIAEVRREPK